MADEGPPTADIDLRIAAVAVGADLNVIADALLASRDEILGRWLETAKRQPFHRERPDGAVADHIPQLFDGIVLALRQRSEHDATSPIEDPGVAAAATAHAQARFEQGLGPIAVVTEFRILRQEIGRSLAALLDDAAPASDVVAGLAVVGDAIDGAATIGLTSLSDRIETLRESFLATTVHDVRQPITLVEGSLHLAQRWLDTTPLDIARLQESVGDALAATGELVAMIDTLSDASQVAMGALDADPEPASLEAIVREAVGAFGAAARGRVTLSVPEGRHLIGLWDPRLLRRVVANLVGNALKYSPNEGQVRVTVGQGRPGWARLTVADDGIGMTADELSSVFDRFTRAERARRLGVAGLGLGLYACRGIVTAHAGTMEVTSAGEGAGTTVVVELPILGPDADV
jgi:signal transduction histidine kinase